MQASNMRNICRSLNSAYFHPPVKFIALKYIIEKRVISQQPILTILIHQLSFTRELIIRMSHALVSGLNKQLTGMKGRSERLID